MRSDQLIVALRCISRQITGVSSSCNYFRSSDEYRPPPFQRFQHHLHLRSTQHRMARADLVSLHQFDTQVLQLPGTSSYKSSQPQNIDARNSRRLNGRASVPEPAITRLINELSGGMAEGHLNAEITLQESRGNPQEDGSPCLPDELLLSTSPEALPTITRNETRSAGRTSRQPLATQPDLPEPLMQGVPMIKISNRKVKQRTFRLEPPVHVNPALGELVGDRRGVEGYATICWESRKIGRGESRDLSRVLS